MINMSDEMKSFVERVQSFGFTVYVAERGHYGFITDATERRVLSFSFSDGTSLSGNYGPPSTISGTGWRMDERPHDLTTELKVHDALYAYPPSWVGSTKIKGWSYLVTVAQYLERYNSSSRFTKMER